MPRPSSAITLDTITLPTRRKTGAATIVIPAPSVTCAVAHKKENNHVTQKPFVLFVRFNRCVNRLGVRSRRREVCLRFGGVSAELRSTSLGQSPGIRRHSPKPSVGQRHLEHCQLAAMLSDH